MLSARIASLEATLAERDARLAELLELVTKLTGQIDKLTEQLGQNSKNSHLPRSSDAPGSGSRSGSPGRRAQGSGRKRGGQKGHRGSYRELLPVASVEQFVDLFPDVCLGCARCLPRTPDAAAYRYQQLELRDHRPHVTEYRRHEVECEHRKTWTLAADNNHARIPSSAFGPCLTAVIGMLTGAYLSRVARMGRVGVGQSDPVIERVEVELIARAAQRRTGRPNGSEEVGAGRPNGSEELGAGRPNGSATRVLRRLPEPSSFFVVVSGLEP